MAHGIGVGVTVKTDDRPLSTVLQNREGTVIAPYTMGGLKEWIVEFTDREHSETFIIHERFLVDENAPKDTSIPTAEELLTIAGRQFHRAALLEKGSEERKEAILLSRIAAEMFVEKLQAWEAVRS